MKRLLRTALVLVVIFLGAVAGGALVMLTRPVDASRDASGTYTLPVNSENPAVAGTPIKSADHNATMTDVKTEITDSLSRSAKGAMLAQLKLFDGTLATPGLGWGTETGSGWRRAAAGDFRFVVSGVDKHWLSATGLGIGIAPAFLFETINPAAGDAAAQIGTTVPLMLRTNNPGIGFNAYNDGANDKRVATGFSSDIIQEPGAGNLLFRTAGTGTAGTITMTQRLSVGAAGTTVSTGIGTDGSGFKHQSVAGCTTAAAVGATCPSTLTWATTFADANYHTTCGCNGTTGVPVVASYSVSAGSVAITTAALTAVAATCTNISCVAVHN